MTTIVTANPFIVPCAIIRMMPTINASENIAYRATDEEVTAIAEQYA